MIIYELLTLIIDCFYTIDVVVSVGVDDDVDIVVVVFHFVDVDIKPIDSGVIIPYGIIPDGFNGNNCL